MALLGNYSVLTKNPGRSFGGGSTKHVSGVSPLIPQLPSLWKNTGAMRNWAVQAQSNNALELVSFPTGYGSTGWMMPVQRGQITAINQAYGNCTVIAVGSRGRNLITSSAGVGAQVGVLTAIGHAVGATAGTSTAVAVRHAAGVVIGSSAGQSTAVGVLKAALNGVGSSAGTSTVTGTISGAISIVGSTTGAGNQTGVLTAIGYAIGSSAGSSTATIIGRRARQGTGSSAGIGSQNGVVTAIGHIAGSSSGSSSAVAVSHAAGVLVGSIAPAVTLEAGAFSSYLLDQSDVETGLTLRQALRLIAAATAGKVSGGGGTTITFRNPVADTDDRIIATVDVDGNRTAITYDLD